MKYILKELQEDVKRNFGYDCSVLVSRATYYGHEDNCLLFYGKRNKAAAYFTSILPKPGEIESVEEENSSYSTVTWAD